MTTKVIICKCSSCIWNNRAIDGCLKEEVELDANGECQGWEKAD